MTKPPKDRSREDSHYARLRRAHRDAHRTAPAGGHKPRPEGGPPLPPDQVRLYGLHTVRAALDNPERRVTRLVATRNALARLGIDADTSKPPFALEIVTPQAIDREIGADAVHQGVMIEASALPVRRLDSLSACSLVLVLDQVTDPHNVGAIMRSAVAFEAGAIVTTMRHSPQESGVLAKSASGALELIPYIQVTNLADALDELRGLGFLTIGLDSEGPDSLEETLSGRRIALVMGSEGKGLRQKTRATVGRLARLDMPGKIKSLNVSNAAAIALYAARRHLASS